MAIKKFRFPLSLGIPTSQNEAMSFYQCVAGLQEKVDEVIDVVNALVGGGTLPDVTSEENGYLLTVIDGEWRPSNNVNESVSDINGTLIAQAGDIQAIQRTVNEIYSGLSDIAATLNAINREVI